MEKLASIYKIINNVNDFVYIGVTTKTIEERFKTHIKNSRKNYEQPLYQDIRRLGEDKFKIEKIDECFERHKFIVEEYWTDYYFEQGYPMYNIKKGACHSENTKQRMSELRQHVKFDYSSSQFKSKMSEKTSGENNGMYGKKGENAVNGRLVVAYDANENIIHTFTSVQNALRFLGIKGHSKLNEACRTGKLYKGFYWKKEWINR